MCLLDRTGDRKALIELVKSEKGSLIAESTDDKPNLNFAVIVTIASNVRYSRLKHFSQPENVLLKQLEFDQRTFISSFPTDVNIANWAEQSKTNFFCEPGQGSS